MSLSSKKVVVFEQDLITQRLLQLALRAYGCVPEFFEDSKLGLQELKNGAPADLVLLEVDRDRGAGFQILKELKTSPITQRIPIMLLSTSAQQATVIQGAKLGASDYIRKPFHPQQLLERVAKHLG